MNRRWLLPSVLAEVIVAALLVGIFATDGENWDFSGFYDTGRRVLSGELGTIYDSSSPIAGAPARATLFYTGTPLASFLFAPLALMDRPIAMVVMKVLNAVAVILAVFVLAREHRRNVAPGDDQFRRYVTRVAAAALVFQPLWATYAVGGQSTPFAFLLLALAFGPYVRDQNWVVSCLLVAVALIKPAFAPLCALIVLLGGAAMLARGTLVAAVVGLGSLGLLGWPVHLEFIRTTIRQATMSATWVYNSSLFVVLDNLTIGGFVDETSVLTVLQVVVQLALLVSLFRVTLVRDRTSAEQVDRRALRFWTATVVGLALLPILWEHYLQLLFVPAMYLLAVWPRLSPFLRILGSAMFASAILQNVLVTGPLYAAGHVSSLAELVAIGILKSAPIWLMLVIFLFRRVEPLGRGDGTREQEVVGVQVVGDWVLVKERRGR